MMNVLLGVLDGINNSSVVTGNATGGMLNCLTENMLNPIKCFQGDATILVGAAILIVGALICIYLFRNIIANSIAGIAALLIIVYLLGVPIPLTPLVLLVAIFGGLGGVGALLIATFFGWL